MCTYFNVKKKRFNEKEYHLPIPAAALCFIALSSVFQIWLFFVQKKFVVMSKIL